jgi:hypothetical protein
MSTDTQSREGFLFGSEWALSRGGIASFYQDVFKYASANSHRFKLVYVSIDTDVDAFRRAVAHKPFLLSMEFHDGSNLPSSSHDDGPIPPLARDEHYLLADDPDMEPEGERDPESTEPPVYARPFSRAHLAGKWGIVKVPTLLVYDLRTGQILNRNVQPALVTPDRVEKTWEAWQMGDSANLSLKGRPVDPLLFVD